MVVLLCILITLIIISFVLLLIFTTKVRIEIVDFSIKSDRLFDINFIKKFVDELASKENLTRKEIANNFLEYFFIIKYNIKCSIYLLNKIRIFSITFNESTVKIFNKSISKQKFLNSKIIRKIESENKIIEQKITLKNVTELLPKIKKVSLYIEIGTTSIILSTYLSMLLNAFAILVFSKLAEENRQDDIKNWKYFISQLVMMQNCINLIFSCIVEWNFAHIIHIVKLLKNGRVNESGKSSNRKSNEKCYG
mgnify:CR=1 FL=1